MYIEVPVPVSCTMPTLEIIEVPVLKGEEITVKDLAVVYLDTRRNLERCNAQSIEYNRSFNEQSTQ